MADRGVIGQNLFGPRDGARGPLNRYPLWRYLLILSVVVLGLVYATPNLFPPDYALQLSPDNSERRMDDAFVADVIVALEDAGVTVLGSELTPRGALIRVGSNDDQLRGRAALDAALNPAGEVRAFVVALNLASTTPGWLESIGGKPMAKGLDLSGGIHFVLEVDVESALAKRLEDDAENVRVRLREERIRYLRTGEMVQDDSIRIGFADAALRDRALEVLAEDYPQPNYRTGDAEVGGRPGLVIEVDPAQIADIEDYAINQNMVSLRNRVNEIGVSEPLVQRLGQNRIVVDLPGVQDASAAKRILDKFANLEFHLLAMPDDRPSEIEEMLYEGRMRRLQRSIIVTGDRVTNAKQGYDPQTSLPQVNITLDSIGGERMHDATAPNVGHSMAIVFIEQKPVKQADGSVVVRNDRRLISVATIQAPLGYNFRITGLSGREAQELALGRFQCGVRHQVQQPDVQLPDILAGGALHAQNLDPLLLQAGERGKVAVGDQRHRQPRPALPSASTTRSRKSVSSRTLSAASDSTVYP